jgi:hypothetical protein
MVYRPRDRPRRVRGTLLLAWSFLGLGFRNQKSGPVVWPTACGALSRSVQLLPSCSSLIPPLKRQLRLGAVPRETFAFVAMLSQVVSAADDWPARLRLNPGRIPRDDGPRLGVNRQHESPSLDRWSYRLAFIRFRDLVVEVCQQHVPAVIHENDLFHSLPFGGCTSQLLFRRNDPSVRTTAQQ